jgi:hypothetical protein
MVIQEEMYFLYQRAAQALQTYNMMLTEIGAIQDFFNAQLAVALADFEATESGSGAFSSLSVDVRDLPGGYPAFIAGSLDPKDRDAAAGAIARQLITLATARDRVVDNSPQDWCNRLGAGEPLILFGVISDRGIDRIPLGLIARVVRAGGYNTTSAPYAVDPASRAFRDHRGFPPMDPDGPINLYGESWSQTGDNAGHLLGAQFGGHGGQTGQGTPNIIPLDHWTNQNFFKEHEDLLASMQPSPANPMCVAIEAIYTQTGQRPYRPKFILYQAFFNDEEPIVNEFENPIPTPYPKAGTLDEGTVNV